MRLAERLGKTQRQLLDEMGSEELSKWMAKDRIDMPVDCWFIAGAIIATIRTMLGSGKKVYSPQDIFPFLGSSGPRRKPRKQTVAEMRAIFGGFASRHAPKEQV